MTGAALRDVARRATNCSKDLRGRMPSRQVSPVAATRESTKSLIRASPVLATGALRATAGDWRRRPRVADGLACPFGYVFGEPQARLAAATQAFDSTLVDAVASRDIGNGGNKPGWCAALAELSVTIGYVNDEAAPKSLQHYTTLRESRWMAPSRANRARFSSLPQ